MDLQHMSHLGQSVEGGGRNARLDHDSAAELLAIGEARLFLRSLDVHVVVNNIRNKLRMSKRLIEAAHDAKANVLLAVLHERGNDGVERALATGKRIGRRGIEREKASAVLQGESHAHHGHVRSKVVVVALDEREDIAFAIDDGEVSGVAGAKRSWGDRAVGFVRIDE